MKYRAASAAIPELDGLTREEIERVRGAAAASVTPGLEAFAEGGIVSGAKARTVIVPAGTTFEPLTSTDTVPTRKRGRRT